MNLFERALLFFILGNGDAHLKNFSLLRKEEIGYLLSQVYDIVNSRLVFPEEKDEKNF
ncbi:MAG: HipA domain-containing protein [Deltaproteobacteria bacterium]|nr:HipA domain-containing protein [Deltaproteobacteria bacterium]